MGNVSLPPTPSLVSALALWPCALDVVENGADVRVAQHVCEAGHVALVSAADHGGGAFPNDAEQDIVRMVPGVAAGVVGWRRQPAGRKRRAPARLALQFRAVAGGALIRIDLASLRDDVRRRHGGGCGTGITPASKDREDHTSDDQTDHDSISESFFKTSIADHCGITFAFGRDHVVPAARRLRQWTFS